LTVPKLLIYSSRVGTDPTETKEIEMTHFCMDGDDCRDFDVDPVIVAITALEVAVDDYAHGVFVNVTNPDPEDVPVFVLGQAVVEAATDVALAMVDADVNGAESSAQIPAELREAAAEAEIAAIRENRLIDKAKCRRCAGTGQFITYVENGVPKGPGGECFRCGGKRYQDEADRRRNYGHDNFAPIAI